MAESVGFLWDSLSANTGDEAIGVHLMRWAMRQRWPAQAVDPATALAANHPVLVIGGGELLHPAGHPFYDVFRVRGPHVLNAVGVYGDVEDADHLAEYRLVSVRSEGDRAALIGLSRPIDVVPCTSLLFGELAHDDAASARAPGAFGLHVHAGSLAGDRLVDEVTSLRVALGPDVVPFSFTRYNADAEVARALAEVAGWPPPVQLASPDAAFAFIARLGAAVVSSLHAMLFAYQCGVPFLVFGYAQKIARFTNERSLDQRVVRDAAGLAARRHLLERSSVDWTESLARDRERVREHLDRVGGAIADGLAQSRGRPTSSMAGDPRHLHRVHEMMLASHAIYGSATAAALRAAWTQHESRRYAGKLEQELTARAAHQAELEEHVHRLETEVTARAAQQTELEEHLHRLQTEVAARAAQQAELEEHVHRLQPEVAARAAQQAEIDGHVRHLQAHVEAVEGHRQAAEGRLSALEGSRWTRLGRRLRLLRP